MTAPSVDDIRRHLAELPELCALLPDAATTRTTIEGPRPAPASKPPLRLDVLVLMDERVKHRDMNMATCGPDRQGVLPYLWGWCRDIEADALDQSPQLPPELPEHPTVSSCCEWLTGMLDFTATLPQWFEYADGIQRTHASLRAATISVRDIETTPVPCNFCGAGQLRESGPRLWKCGACGHEVSVVAVTLPQAHRILKQVHGDRTPKLRTLQNWANRPGLMTGLLDQGPRSRVFDMATIRSLTADYLLRSS